MRQGSGRGEYLSCLLALAAAAGLCPAGALASDLYFSRRDPISIQLSAPGAVAVDAGGSVYVSEPGRNRVVIFDALGNLRTSLDGLDRPVSLAVDRAGTVFVGSAGRGSVEVFTPELTLQGRLGSGAGEFGQPSGIAVDGDGTVYVADSKENLVKVYRPDGTRQAAIGGGADAGPAFHFPTALAVNDATGEIVVTDLGDNLLSRGAYGGARVQVLTKTGALVRSFGHYGRGEGLLVKPLGVATDDAGKVYVTDAFQNVVQVFDQAGSYLGTVHDVGHPLRTPLGVAFGRGTGTLYVCSLTAGRVETFDVIPPPQSVALSVAPAGDGSGTVVSVPAGIACPGVCSAIFPAGTAVTLAAEADAGSAFSGWSGACVGTAACVLNMSEDLEVIPHFEASSPDRRVASDFNGDGLSDILWLDRAGHQVSTWLIDRDLRPHASPLASALRQRLGGVADVGGDGKADILWHSNKGSVAIWSMDGAAIAAVHKLGAMEDPAYEIAGVADFTGDGCADILWRHARTGTLRLWELAEHAVGADRKVGAVQDPQWEIAGLADFDGDGRSDILWRHGRSGSLQIWFMDGALVRSSGAPVRSRARNDKLAGCGDFNGDGSADILWRSSADGGLSYWPLENGTAGAAVALADPPDKRWDLAAIGDYDGDGHADLLVRRPAGNKVAVCLTTDASTLRCAALGSSPVHVTAEGESAP